jgi:UDP-glucose 4-epimerase
VKTARNVQSISVVSARYPDVFWLTLGIHQSNNARRYRYALIVEVLITGGAGFIGASLANTLSLNHKVTVLDNLSSGYWSRVEGDCSRVSGDLEFMPFATLLELFRNIDVLYHLAAVKLHNEYNSIEKIEYVNLLATEKIAIAAGMAGVKKVIFTSSLYAYGNKGPLPSQEDDPLKPYNDYGRSKKMGEEILSRHALEYGYELVIARPYFIYGPKQFAKGGYKSVITNNVERYHAGLPLIVVGSGLQQMDFVHIDDCVNALERMLEPNVKGTYNISSEEAFSILDVMKIINKGEKCSIEFIPPDWTENTVRVGSSEKLRKILEWKPQVSLAEGIRELLRART